MEAPQKIEVESGERVVLTWIDGTATIDARTLREACQCADCRSEAGTRRKSEVLSGSRPITIEGAELRGAYAINFVFGPDGHGTGIFTWDLLRRLGNRPA